MKKLVYGVGINDAGYNVYKYEVINGKNKIVWTCPFYKKWVTMLGRCYSEKCHEEKPTYKNCTVCQEWLTFSNFRRWCVSEGFYGSDTKLNLDKDFLKDGNKLYSPIHCVFLNKIVNTFILDRGNARGQYMIGANWYKPTSKFISHCSNPFTKKLEYLGYFTDELEAHLTWKKRKHELSCQLADSDYVTDERIKKVLLNKYK